MPPHGAQRFDVDDNIKTKILDRKLIIKLLRYLKPYLHSVIISFVVLIALAGVELFLPMVTKSAMDDFIVPIWKFYQSSDKAKIMEVKDQLKDGTYIEYNNNEKYYLAIDNREIARVAKNDSLFNKKYKISKELNYIVPNTKKNITLLTRNDVLNQKTDLNDKFFAFPYSAIQQLDSKDVLSLQKEVRYKSHRKILNFWQLGLVFLFGILFRFVSQFLQIYFTRSYSQKAMNDLRSDLYEHLQKMPTSFFDKNPVGRLVTRVTNDIRTLDEMLAQGVITIVQDVILIVVIIAIMLIMSWKLALVSFITIPIVIVLIIIFKRQTRKIYRVVRKKLASLNSTLAEHMSGAKLINLFNRREFMQEKFDSQNEDYFASNYQQLKLFALFRPLIRVMSVIASALILWYGGGQIIDGTITIGTFLAFSFYVGKLFEPINDFSEKFNILQAAMAGAERIFDLMEDDVEDYREELTENKLFQGRIEFRNVWLAYIENEWILKDVSFIAEPGEKIALVGHTGSGKTTIVSLILGLYPFQKGDILIDGKSIREYSLKDIRRNIGIVQQDVFLFAGNIRDNIRLSNKNISEDKLIEVAKHVNVHRFIDKLPGKYDEPVMERGATFSVGQRQLISFARVLAYNPAIFILDEATSNVDTETEILIQDALTKIMKGRTSIVIAHRLSTIQHSDRIIVLHHGRIVEEGSHQALLQKEGMYYDLYRLQYS